jgi:L-aminopeptidase/D-esterase-like protein
MLTAIAGIRVGHASDLQGCTGCTVVLCPEGTVGGVDIRGGASGTREMDALCPDHLVPHAHAVLLAGGSAFGLDAAAGVMRYLEERSIGFDVGVTHVPIVPTAILFDLRVGDPRARPTPAMAYAACEQASDGPVAEGSVGAGTGATVGKILGIAHSMKSGLGTAIRIQPDGLAVAALAVVNAFGDVRDPATGRLLAGARVRPDSAELADTAGLLRQGTLPRGYRGHNTTLVVLATNARLSKIQATRLARVAHHGLSAAIIPAHTTLDGDLVVALATGRQDADPDQLGILAADAVADAVIRAVTTAVSLGGLPAWQDLQEGFGVRGDR